MQVFVADAPERYHEASPVHQVHAGAPPFFVIHGDIDTLAPVEDVARCDRDACRVQGARALLEMQGAQHAFEVFPRVRTAKVIEGVERFLSTLWARRQVPTAAVESELDDTLTE